jgi:hypothetical protein
LRLIPWREAARVDAAVQRLAETGEGDLEWVDGSRADYRLFVAPFVVLLELDPDAALMQVWSVSRRLS